MSGKSHIIFENNEFDIEIELSELSVVTDKTVFVSYGEMIAYALGNGKWFAYKTPEEIQFINPTLFPLIRIKNPTE